MEKKAAQAHIVVFNTCPDEETAQTIAAYLLENRLAACVNILGNMQSVYRWKGEIERDAEVLLIIKTRRDKFEALSSMIRHNHPYELPEVVAVPIDTGLPEYLNWIDQSLEPKQ